MVTRDESRTVLERALAAEVRGLTLELAEAHRQLVAMSASLDQWRADAVRYQGMWRDADRRLAALTLNGGAVL